MNFKNLVGETIKVTTVKGKIYRGIVEDYCFPDDNESGDESIIVKFDKDNYGEFDKTNIRTLEIVG